MEVNYIQSSLHFSTACVLIFKEIQSFLSVSILHNIACACRCAHTETRSNTHMHTRTFISLSL
eukprot:c34844_g1_i1 orf=3-188(-)